MAKRKSKTTTTKSHTQSIKSKRSTSRRSKTKRERSRYPALNPGLNLKTRTDLIDYDYIDKLSEKDKKWLNKFTEEYVNASIDTSNLKKNLHNTQELKKDCFDRNNARNRCILTLQRAQSKIEYLEDNKKLISENPEDSLIKDVDIQTRNYYDDYNELAEPIIEKSAKRRK